MPTIVENNAAARSNLSMVSYYDDFIRIGIYFKAFYNERQERSQGFDERFIRTELHQQSLDGLLRIETGLNSMFIIAPYLEIGSKSFGQSYVATQFLHAGETRAIANCLDLENLGEFFRTR